MLSGSSTPPYLTTMTRVADQAILPGLIGFSRFGYSLGKHGRPVAMTAPVSQAREKGRWRIAFMMPSAYTMETLPIPDDDRIVLREEEEKTVAVIRYSGTWGKKRYENHATQLMDWVSKKGWKIIGTPVWARYNPPFTPWFMRRNEVLIPVEIQ